MFSLIYFIVLNGFTAGFHIKTTIVSLLWKYEAFYFQDPQYQNQFSYQTKTSPELLD